MIPIVCFVGASGSGKTTFLEKLIPILTDRGYRVGTVKHDVHGFEMDREGKDTWRHGNAGAGTIGIVSPRRVASIRSTQEEMDLARFVGKTFWSEDVVLAEGFKRSPFPKIEIFRSVLGYHPLCDRRDHLVALVTDDLGKVDGQFDDVSIFALHEPSRVADFIIERYLRERKSLALQVFLDGKRLPMNHFVEEIISGAVKGMLTTLRGWDSPGTVDIQMKLRGESE